MYIFSCYRAGIFDEEQARLYAAEIVAAIAHLHSLHIVHRDLKPVSSPQLVVSVLIHAPLLSHTRAC